MATKFLDNTGLAYFWSKIKSYIANLLNLKADDSAVVHITGTETITGTKTLSSINTITYSDTAAGNTKNILYGRIASTDYFRVLVGGASNAGYLELATADDGNEPIYIRQYKGVFTTLQRTATLLDASGNTVFPGIVTASGFIGNITGDCSGSSGSCTGNAATATTATKANALASSTTPLGNGLIYITGGLTLGSSAGQLYKGSSNNAALISAPENGTYYNSTAGNVQNLRLAWSTDGKYLTDIFASPNNDFIWHRNVSNGTAKPWRRLVEENATGITAPNWNISITGNAATASAVAWSGVTSKPTTIAGYGITDAKIANGTITLGSNSITPLTSVPSHNQASNTINAMTGYSKPSAGSAIAASDTLNSAIGKLEAKVDAVDDSNYVHKTGDETITGLKVFNDNLEVYGINDDITTIGLKSNIISIGEDPATDVQFRIIMSDQMSTLAGHRFGIFRTFVYTNGDVASLMEAFQNVSSNQVHTAISVVVKKDGTKYATAPSTLSSRSEGTDILTRDWIPNDSRIVRTSGDQTVSGNKTFTSDIVVGNHDVRTTSDADFLVLNGGEGESQYRAGRLVLYGKDYPNASSIDTTMAGYFNLSSTDGTNVYKLVGSRSGTLTWRGNNVMAGLTTTGSGNAVTSISVSDNTLSVAKGSTFLTALTNVSEMGRYIDFHYDNATAAYNYDVRLGCSSQGSADGGGNLTVTANAMYIPVPASNANDARAATCGWVNSKGYLTSHQSLNSCVKTSGDQNIGGAKTFTSDITVQNNAPYMYIKQNDVQAGTTPDSSYSGIHCVDKNGKAYGSIISRFYGGQNGCIELIGYDVTSASATAQANVRICCHSGIGKIMEPDTNGDILFGRSSHRWKEIWCTQSSINSSSDERDKTAINDIPNEVLDAWENISWLQFKFKDAVKEKLDNARLHTGVIAQYIDKVFKDKGLDASKYGLFLYDKWEKEEDEDYDENGNLRHAASLAGDSYGIRYVEALCMEAAYQRRKNKILENHISELEKQVSDMLVLLQNLTNGNG